MGFPGGAAVKNLPADTGGTEDEGSTPGPGRSPGLGNGNPLQYSLLQNSTDRGAWWATIHGVAKSQPWLNAHARGLCAITPDPADLRLGYLLSSPRHDTAFGLASTFPHVSLSSRADGLSVTNLWYEVVWLHSSPPRLSPPENWHAKSSRPSSVTECMSVTVFKASSKNNVRLLLPISPCCRRRGSSEALLFTHVARTEL